MKINENEWNKRRAFSWLRDEAERAYKHYLLHATREEAECYNAYYNAFLVRDLVIKMPSRDANVCQRAFELCMNDNPLFFYVESLTFSISLFSINATVNYSINEDDTVTALYDIYRHLEHFRKKCEGAIEEQKEYYVHNSLVGNIEYDSAEGRFNVHSPYSVFKHRRAVCDGISKAAKMMFDALGMRSVFVAGRSSPRSNIAAATSFGDDAGHAWNIVYIRGEPYHIDITFDNTLTAGRKNAIRFDYFNLTEAQIRRDHEFADIGISAVKENDHFRANGLFFKGKQPLKTAFAAALARGDRYFGFRLPFPKDTKRLYDEMCAAVRETLSENLNFTGTLSYNISFNEDQMVVYILL